MLPAFFREMTANSAFLQQLITANIRFENKHLSDDVIPSSSEEKRRSSAGLMLKASSAAWAGGLGLR